jgi:hypothetical protein
LRERLVLQGQGRRVRLAWQEQALQQERLAWQEQALLGRRVSREQVLPER